MSISLENLDKENKRKLKEGIVVSSSIFMANVMHEVVRCKEFPTLPRHSHKLFDDVLDIFEKECDKHIYDFHFIEFKNLKEIKEWLYKNIYPLQEIQQLNLSRYEWEQGIRDCESERLNKCGVEILDDFIDLDAFIRNLAQDLLRDSLDFNYASFYDER